MEVETPMAGEPGVSTAGTLMLAKENPWDLLAFSDLAGLFKVATGETEVEERDNLGELMAMLEEPDHDHFWGRVLKASRGHLSKELLLSQGTVSDVDAIAQAVALRTVRAVAFLLRAFADS